MNDENKVLEESNKLGETFGVTKEVTPVAPVEAVSVAPAEAVSVAPVEAVPVAPVEAVSVAPAEAVSVAPVEAVSVAPVEAVSGAPAEATPVASSEVSQGAVSEQTAPNVSPKLLKAAKNLKSDMVILMIFQIIIVLLTLSEFNISSGIRIGCVVLYLVCIGLADDFALAAGFLGIVVSCTLMINIIAGGIIDFILGVFVMIHSIVYMIAVSSNKKTINKS